MDGDGDSMIEFWCFKAEIRRITHYKQQCKSPTRRVCQTESTHCLKCGNYHSGSECTTNTTTFYWTEKAKEVFLVGDWSNWSRRDPMIHMGKHFEFSVCLGVGSHQYKFVVDGVWRLDDKTETVCDMLGNKNNVIEVLPKKVYIDQYRVKVQDQVNICVTITSTIQQDGLKIVGSWDDWEKQQPLKSELDLLMNRCVNNVDLELLKGNRYEFRFVNPEGQYFVEESYPSIEGEDGVRSNYIITSSFQEIQTPKCVLADLVRRNSSYERQWEWCAQQYEDLRAYNLYGHSLNCVGEYLYVFGGLFRKKFMDEMIKISLHNLGECKPLKVDIEARAFHNSVTDGNNIIIFGGLNTSVLDDCLVYNTATGAWTNITTLGGKGPSKRQKSTSILYKGTVIVYGGYFCCPKNGKEEVYNDIHSLDIRTMKWTKPFFTTFEDAPARFAHTSTIYGDDMLVFGGLYSTDSKANTNQLWTMRFQKDHLSWTKTQTIGTPPSPRHGHTANILLHYLVVFGGADDVELLNDVKMLDLNKMGWITPVIDGDIPKPMSYHAAIVTADELLVVGGKTQGSKDVSKIMILKVKSEKRKSFSMSPSFSNMSDNGFL